MVGSDIQFGCVDCSVFCNCSISERSVELNDKIVAEIFGDTTTVAGSVSGDTTLLWIYRDRRTAVECVNNDIGAVSFRESETEHGCA